MQRWKGRVALVTGASVGIGNATARALVQHGMKVVGCARDVDKIRETAAELQQTGAAGQLYPVQCDLTVEAEIRAMFDDIQSQHGGVDVCINNAGLAIKAPLLSGSFEDFRTMTDVNILAPTLCTQLAVQQMRKRGVDDGHIITLNSMSGHRLVGSNAFYSMTKFAITAMTEGLRRELREMKSHIRATCISPGLVETEFAIRLHKDDVQKAHAAYASIECLQAKDLADMILYVLGAPPHVEFNDIWVRPTEQVF
ncbi:PREDICTED: dehydrogenase/reductase SDR family member 11-like [Branchiostoma belcheri]|uniref:Dehydrogenase/reductase SDR family member 11 n=1 Tax=Branchiostoma belcheri TaxID=7741 RepID=A0A6P5AD06_BRABE|nr:PREDICTED: dehydrogenase/reductase SDR family member 11-like [Branchiostoma belcheri]